MKQGAPVVFFQHGLFSDSNTWVVQKEEALAVKLAKDGYDIWLGNNRGTLYSRANTHLDPAKDYVKFFDYSFFELGEYDLPTQVNYVLTHSGHKKLSYIGHSQGTS